MTSVTVVGLGPMGHALASAFLAAGHPVTVWNRTPGRGSGLLDQGVVVADSVADAVRAGEVVVVCLIDYAAVREVVSDTVAREVRLLVNLTSGEPDQAREMAAWAAAHDISYLDGAVLTSTPAIGTPAGTVLFSGDKGAHAAVQETMNAVGGTTLFLGEDPGLASAYDVALLDLFATSMAGVAHSFALASAEGIDLETFAAFAQGIGRLLPESITRFAEQIRADDFPGDRSTIASAASGINHIMNAAAAHGLDVGVLTAAKAIIDRAIADGHGPEGLGRLTATLSRRPA